MFCTYPGPPVPQLVGIHLSRFSLVFLVLADGFRVDGPLGIVFVLVITLAVEASPNSVEVGEGVEVFLRPSITIKWSATLRAGGICGRLVLVRQLGLLPLTRLGLFRALDGGFALRLAP